MSELSGDGDNNSFDANDSPRLPLDQAFQAAVDGFFSSDLHPGHTIRPIRNVDTFNDYKPPVMTGGKYDVNQFHGVKATPAENSRNSAFLTMLTSGLYERFNDYITIRDASPHSKDTPDVLVPRDSRTLLELTNNPDATSNENAIRMVVDGNRLAVSIDGNPSSYAIYRSFGSHGVYKNRHNPLDQIVSPNDYDGPIAMVRDIQADQFAAASEHMKWLYGWENWEKVGKQELAYVAGLIGLVGPRRVTAVDLEERYYTRAATEIEASISDAQIAGDMFTQVHRRFLERRGVDIASAYPVPYTYVIPDTPHSTFRLTAGFGAFSDPLTPENTSLAYDDASEQPQPYFQMYHETRGEDLPDFREMMFDRLEALSNVGHEVASGLPSYTRTVVSCYVDSITKAYLWRLHEVIYGEFDEQLCNVRMLMLGDRGDVDQVRNFMFDPRSGFKPEDYNDNPPSGI